MDLVERPGRLVRRHPWESTRAEFYLRLLAASGAAGDARSWLDVGAGDGWFAGELRRGPAGDGRIVCWDINYSPGDIPAGDFEVTDVKPAGRFDAVLMLDVIEHVAADQQFVAEVVTDLVRPGGWVLVSVPAHQRLFTSHDVSLQHYRRYAPAGCRAVLERAGLSVLRDGGLFHLLALVRWAEAVAERARVRKVPDSGIGGWNGGPVLTRAVSAALRLDNAASRCFSALGWSPPGLSYWALCRRASNA